MDILRVYLDVCCLCRPFDDQTQPRNFIESQAVLEILRNCGFTWTLVISDLIEFELAQIPDKMKYLQVYQNLPKNFEYVEVDDDVMTLYSRLVVCGCSPVDAMHVAFSRKAKATFLTTDDLLLGIIRRPSGDIIICDNPVTWLTRGDYV
jgi:hypothetical protein